MELVPKCTSCGSYLHDCYPNIELTACNTIVCVGCTKDDNIICKKCNKKLIENHYLRGSIKTIILGRIYNRKYTHDDCKIETETNVMAKHIKKCELAILPCIYCCEATRRKNMEEHYSTCVHKPTDCESCKKKFRKIDIPTHMTECTERIINCIHECGESMERRKIKNHQIKCPNRPVKCEHCFIQIKQLMITEHEKICDYQHYECECGEIPTIREKTEHDKKCSHALIVCPLNCKETIKAKDIPKHLLKCPYAYSYNHILKDQYRNVDGKKLSEASVVSCDNVNYVGGLYDLYINNHWRQICVTNITFDHIYFVYVNNTDINSYVNIVSDVITSVKINALDNIIAPYLSVTNCYPNIGDIIVYSNANTLGTSLYTIDEINYSEYIISNKESSNKIIIPKEKYYNMKVLKEYKVGSLVNIYDKWNFIVKIISMSEGDVNCKIIKSITDLEDTTIDVVINVSYFKEIINDFTRQNKYFSKTYPIYKKIAYENVDHSFFKVDFD